MHGCDLITFSFINRVTEKTNLNHYHKWTSYVKHSPSKWGIGYCVTNQSVLLCCVWIKAMNTGLPQGCFLNEQTGSGRTV